MQDFNRFEIPIALRGFLDTAENPRLAMEETVQPVASIGDVTDTPYIKYGITCGGRVDGTAEALKYSWCAVVPGGKVALQVLQLIISNQNAAVRLLDMRLVTLAALTSASGVAGDFLTDFAPRVVTNVTLSSRMYSGVHATPPSPIGYLAALAAPASNSLVITLPRPGIILFGDAAGGTPALVMQGSIANEALTYGVVAREWPLPGIKQ